LIDSLKFGNQPTKIKIPLASIFDIYYVKKFDAVELKLPRGILQ
jgi:hypothetical protein